MVRVGTVPDRRDTNHVYWFERQIMILGRRQSVAWADTQGCTAARTHLARMAALAPRFDRLGSEDEVELVADGASYVLDAPVADGNGSLHVETTSSGPIRTWIDAMLAALEPCWTAARPVLDQSR